MSSMSSMNYLLWGVFPYIALTLFFVIPFLRMIYRPFGLTTRASGTFYGRDLLGLASHLLHWGIFVVFFGHLFGLAGAILGWGGWVTTFFWMGTIGGLAAITGSTIALIRRATVPEVRAMSQPDDYIVHLFLIAILGVAIYQAVVQQIWGVAYTAGPWFASLWRFQPQPELMDSASTLTKTHIFLAFAFGAYFPFTKLAHAWTLPVNYLVRPYQVMRTTARKFQDRWEFGLVSDKSYMTYLATGVIALLLGIAFLVPGPGKMDIVQVAHADASTLSSDGSVASNRRVVLEGYPLYVGQCARCHGLTGEGDGPGAKSWTFSAVPRNLKAGHFRFVSTENGVATDDDLKRTIAHGLTGSGMPAFGSLSDHQLSSLVEVVGALWQNRPAKAEPIVVPPRSTLSNVSVDEGRKVFAENCSACHGPAGRQDPKNAIVLKDSFGHSVRPRNLASEPIKGGSLPTQLYVRIAAGIPDGKDRWLMPRFRELGPEKIWSLVDYLQAEVLPGGNTSDIKTARR